MEKRLRLRARALRWSLAGLCAALLWIAGSFGGRHAGYDRGHEAGFAAGQAEGYERSLELSTILQKPEGVFDVADLIDERIRAAGGVWNQAVVDAEMAKVVDQIRTEVEPDRWNDPQARRTIDGLPNLVVVVNAEPRLVAEVGAYLRSKDEYLAWKRAESQSP